VSEAMCHAREEEATRHCIEEHCEETEPPAPTCEERCEDHAGDALGRCLEDGGSEDACKAAAHEIFERCVAMQCEVPPPCDARCAKKAGRVERRCLKRGGTADGGAEKGAAAVAECREKRCVPPPPDTCAGDCETAAKAQRAECIAGGTDEATCDAAAKAAL